MANDLDEMTKVFKKHVVPSLVDNIFKTNPILDYLRYEWVRMDGKNYFVTFSEDKGPEVWLDTGINHRLPISGELKTKILAEYMIRRMSRNG